MRYIARPQLLVMFTLVMLVPAIAVADVQHAEAAGASSGLWWALFIVVAGRFVLCFAEDGAREGGDASEPSLF